MVSAIPVMGMGPATMDFANVMTIGLMTVEISAFKHVRELLLAPDMGCVNFMAIHPGVYANPVGTDRHVIFLVPVS